MTTLNDNKFNISIVDLPDSDPQVTGALYHDKGDVRVSSKNNITWSPSARFVPLNPTARSAYTGDNGDWTVDFVSGQMYVYNELTGQMEAIGASLTEVQTLIDGSFSGGDTTLLASNTSVPADGTPGLADPTGQVAGWYYKNSTSLSDKINWYYLANSNPALTMTKGNLDGMYAVVDVRAAGAPYFVVYTKPTGTGDAQPW